VDSIRQAVDLARAGTAASSVQGPAGPRPATIDPQIREIDLNPAHLETTRIVASGATDEHGRYYDMLRTQVLQAMDKNSWQFLAITSPTAGCGKTVTACNLALSIARLPERSVLLVDMDLQKPKISEYLGIDQKEGLLSVLDGRATLLSRIVQAHVGRRTHFLVLPSEACKSGSSEWMASKTMSTLLQTIKREFRSRIVIFDLPPLLLGDDVISILPQMDAALLVAGVGTTTVSDLKECQKHLQTTPVVRVLVNKVTEATDSYYAYY
jgi:Mrp family chromosome partitioning ATPase